MDQEAHLLGQVLGPVFCERCVMSNWLLGGGDGGACSLQHPPVVVPAANAHPLELEVDGVGLVPACCLAVAVHATST